MLEKVWDYLAEAGDMEGGWIIIKSDQEPAVKRLVKDLVEARAEGKSVVGSNGVLLASTVEAGGSGDERCDGGGD